MKLVLASASPRRRELLHLVTEEFEVTVSNEEEILPQGMSDSESAEELAYIKAHSVFKNRSDAVVIGADTIVVLDGEIFGKPQSSEHAAQMLKRLSGNTHTVITGVCIMSKNKTVRFSQRTEVEFFNLSEREISEYVESGEPMDKAGAYAIQGLGGCLVKGIKGEFFNVVGLPVARIKRELEGFY